MGKMKKIYIYIERESETEKSVKVEKVGREREENWVWTKTIFTQRKWFSLKKNCYERENENGEERNERGFKKLGERK